MLINRIYIGEYHFKDTIVSDKVPPIVDKTLFDKVQSKVEKNQRKGPSYKAENKYLLSYKLFCGECGGLMVGESTTKKNGKTYRYYKCQKSKRGHSCAMPSVPKEDIEEAVVRDAREVIEDSNLMDQIIYEAYQSQERETPLMKSLNQELKTVQKKLDNVLNAFENGYGNDELNNRLNELTDAKNELIEQINEEAVENPYMELDEVAAMFSKFKELDFDSLLGRQALIDAFISKIVYHRDGSFDVYFTTKGTKKRHNPPKTPSSGGDSGGENPSGGGSDTYSSGSPS